MKWQRNQQVLCGLSLLSVAAVLMMSFQENGIRHRTDSECSVLRQLDSLYEGYNGWFASSGKCDHCHGLDPAGIASVDYEGADVNVVDDWRSTMMANSARDPFWRAKVSHEVNALPNLQAEIENTCTKCHASLGHFASVFNGEDMYSIQSMASDSIALDGVSCVSCHQQSSEGLGNHFSGELNFLTGPIAFGPFENPLITPMALYSGYTPEYGSHILDAGICAGCHTLITESIDLEGNPTGSHFVEQATYHEWLNSFYNENDITCQGCHMPTLEEQGVILAAGFDTPPKSPFAQHELVGANTLMLGILRDNIDQLGIPATATQFNETISKTTAMLQQKSVDVQLELADRSADTVYVNVKLINKAGHKLPSGYPSRKMSLHFSVTDSLGNTLFVSGGFDTNYYINGEDNSVEQHYDVITSEDQVQVYEMIMGDVGGIETTLLNRGYSHLKDNRLPPLGFSVANAAYDTTEIVGVPSTDLDFNHDPLEGSGSDVVHYHAALGGYTGVLGITASVYYQSLPPTWMEEIFSVSTDEIDSFSEMFQQANKTPILMREEQLTLEPYVGIPSLVEDDRFTVVGRDNGTVQVMAPYRGDIEIFSSTGKRIYRGEVQGGFQIIRANFESACYVFVLRSPHRAPLVHKAILSP